uniref:Uncharacterized protein n=1 Tax=Chaetoceros debilis TaxID=122233 RepID=A0A7S3QD12_9STRA
MEALPPPVVDFETPAKMALSIARGASPNSTGKEILQRYRQMMAKKSLDGEGEGELVNDVSPIAISDASSNGSVDDSYNINSHASTSASASVSVNRSMHRNTGGTALNLSKDLGGGVGVSGGGNYNSNLSIFHDSSSSSINSSNEIHMGMDKKSSSSSIFRKRRVERHEAAENMNMKNNAADKDNSNKHVDDDSNVKRRMKQSLALRRTALRARNMNVPSEEGGGAGNGNGAGKGRDKSLFKKKSASISAMNTNANAVEPSVSKMKSEEMQQVQTLKSSINSAAQIGTTTSLDQVMVDDAKSLSELSSTKTPLSLKMKEMKIGDFTSMEDVSLDLDNEMEDNELVNSIVDEETTQNGLSLATNASLSDSMGRQSLVDIVEVEESDEACFEDKEEIDADDGELISLGASVASTSGSECMEENDEVGPLSLSSKNMEEDCHYSSGSGSGSGITMDSVQTFSIGGRSIQMDMSTTRFRSIFSPTSSTDEVSLMDSMSGGSVAGDTVIPDISIQDGSSFRFPSPTQNMMYASPTVGTNVARVVSSQVSASASAARTLDELSRQLDEVRSEKQKSGQKMEQSAEKAKQLLGVYDKILSKVESSETPQKLKTALSHDVSPVSKLLAVGIDACGYGSDGLSKAAATSLIERNKTLIKEVRFADQTCVELSERNQGLVREMNAMQATTKELKDKSEELQNAVMKASQASARLEGTNDEIALKLREERDSFHLQLKALKESSSQERERCYNISQKLEESNELKSLKERECIAISAKYETNKEELDKAKVAISSLTERLSASQSTSDLAASTAAKEYHQSCNSMQDRINELVELSSERQVSLELERQTRRKVEEELHGLRCLYQEDQFKSKTNEGEANSPALETTHNSIKANHSTSSPSAFSMSSKDSKKTTASTVLAKTLHDELQRGHCSTERIIEAEKIITVTQSKLKDVERDLDCTIKENTRLRKELRKFIVDEGLHDSFYTTKSISSGSKSRSLVTEQIGSDVNEKLASAKSQCEEYKRELNTIISQIKGMEENSSSSSSANGQIDSYKLLETVQDLAQVCTRVNYAAGGRVNELEGRIQFLASSMYHLNEICGDDQSDLDVSGFSYSMQDMEEASRSSSSTESKGGNKLNTPMKVFQHQLGEDALSPTETLTSLKFCNEQTSMRRSHLRKELEAATEELLAVSDEKIALANALAEARRQVEHLTSSKDGLLVLQEEKHSLDIAVLQLREQIGFLETRIENLEEDKAFLFDDAAARGDELEEAAEEIETLENEVGRLNEFLTEVTNEKETLETLVMNSSNSHAEEVELLQAENKRLANTSSVLDDRIRTLLSSNEKFSKEIAETNSECKALKEKVKVAFDNNSRQSERIQELKDALAKARDEFGELKYSFIECNEKLTKATEVNISFEISSAKAQKDIRAHEIELDVRATIIKRTEKERFYLQEKLDKANSTIDAHEKEIEINRMQIASLSQFNDECEDKLHQEQGLRRQQIKSLSTELGEAKDCLDEKDKELSIARSDLKGMENRHSLQIELVRKQELELSAMTVELARIKDCFHDLQGNFENKTLELVSKIEELTLMQVQAERFKISYSELEAKMDEDKTYASSELDSKEIELEQLNEQIYNTRKEFEVKLDKMLSSLSKKEKEMHKISRKNWSLERKCSRMREYVKNLTNQCKEWESTYSEKENISQLYEEKYTKAMSKISDLTSSKALPHR